MADREPAVACNSVAEAETCPTMPPTAASNRSAIWSMPARRCASAEARAAAVSASRARLRIRLSLNTWTAAAIAPISSRRWRNGTSAAVSPPARTVIAVVICWIGREIRRSPNTEAASAAATARVTAA